MPQTGVDYTEDRQFTADVEVSHISSADKLRIS